MNLVLLFPEECGSDGRVCLTDGRAEHIRKTLRAQPGKVLRVGLLNGPLGAATVEAVSNDAVTLACEWNDTAPPHPPVDLLLAMPRPKVLKRLWAQFAALGVRRIFITNAEKVERFYFDTHILEPDFYRARFIEGLQQARDTHLPHVTIVKQLKPFLENEPFPDIGKKLIADPSAGQSLFQALETTEATFPRPGKRVLLAVGPEGGWMPYELGLFRDQGFEPIGMGPRVLRTDTACIGLISMLAECLRESV